MSLRSRAGQRVKDSLRRGALRLLPRLVAAPAASTAEPQRILVIRPDHLGDLLFATPALAALRQAHPQAQIAGLVGPWGAEVVSRNPNVDEVLTCSFPGFAREPKVSPWAPYDLLWREAARLRLLRFDLALNLRFDFWWGAALAYLAGIPQRRGYDRPETRPFLTEARPYIPGRHEVAQNLGLVAGDDSPDRAPLEFPVSPQEEAFAATFHREALGDGPFLVIHPGAGAPVKRWRAEAFAQVAETLSQRHDWGVLLTGTPAEAPLLQAVSSSMKKAPQSLVGAGLGEVAAVLRRSQLVVGVDSGILHLAVAVGAPTVHLFGPVSAQVFGPWGPVEGPGVAFGDPARRAGRHRVVVSPLPCVPCHRLDFPESEVARHPCVRSIPVEAALAAAESAWGGWAAAPGAETK